MAGVTGIMTEQQLADELGIKCKTLILWRRANKAPPHVKIGKGIRYRVEDVKAWLASNVSTG